MTTTTTGICSLTLQYSGKAYYELEAIDFARYHDLPFPKTLQKAASWAIYAPVTSFSGPMKFAISEGVARKFGGSRVVTVTDEDLLPGEVVLGETPTGEVRGRRLSPRITLERALALVHLIDLREEIADLRSK